MKQILSVLTALAMILPTTAWSVTINGSNDGGSIPVNGTSTGLGGTSYQPTQQVYAPTVTTTDSMEKNAREAMKQQEKGKNAAMIAAAVMAGMAAMTCPSCGTRGTCGVCAASLLGAAASMLTGSKMGKAGEISGTQLSDVNPTAPVVGADAPTYKNTPEYNAAIKDMNAAAKSINAKVNKEGTKITMADGRVLDPSSSQGSSSPPMSPSEQATFNAGKAKAEAAIAAALGKDNTGSVAEVNEGASGGAGTRASVAGFAEGGAGNGVNNGLRRPTSVAGAFKEFNGEKIGVSQDSVFEMMHRRYKFHGDADSFQAVGK